MTQTTIPSGDNSLLPSTQMRPVGRFERIIGPDNYRILMGWFKTPASIIGFSLVIFFVLVAVFATVLAPYTTEYIAATDSAPWQNRAASIKLRDCGAPVDNPPAGSITNPAEGATFRALSQSSQAPVTITGLRRSSSS